MPAHVNCRIAKAINAGLILGMAFPIPAQLTALLLTYNEQENIRRTLEALRWVPRVVVLDSCSSDTTSEIARSFSNVELHQREFDTHATQWNYGLDIIKTEWLLALDADYVIPPELAEEVGRLEMEDGVVGYTAEFRYLIFGKPLRASIYPPRVILFRTKQARYVDEGHTQQLRIAGRIERLQGKILHDDRKPPSRWIASQNRYSRLEAEYLLRVNSGLSVNGCQLMEREGEEKEPGARRAELSLQNKVRKMIFLAPVLMPIYLLFGRGLILDGWRGWYYVFQRTVAELLLSLRLLDAKMAKQAVTSDK